LVVFNCFLIVGLFECCLGRTIPMAIHDGWLVGGVERSRSCGIARGNVVGGTFGGKFVAGKTTDCADDTDARKMTSLRTRLPPSREASADESAGRRMPNDEWYP
jgi:hypothetical protein